MNIDNDATVVKGDFFVGKKQSKEVAKAQGIIDAVSSIFEHLGVVFEVVDYSEHTLAHGKDADAVAYFGVKVEDKVYYGAGRGQNISYASVNALVSALNVAVMKTMKKTEESNEWNAK
jgi:2-isopropylmalate synthase